MQTSPLESVSVLSLPRFDPGRDRIHGVVAPGTSVAQIVAAHLPGVPVETFRALRVTIDGHEIDRARWARVKPKAGKHVVIRVVMGESALRSVLQLVVAVAAIALGQYYAVPFAIGGFTVSANVVGALITTAVLVAGNLLINALIPVRQQTNDPGNTKASPTLQGIQNAFNPRGVIPSVLGRHRFAPPFLAPTYTEIVGDDQYLICAFLFGYGPLSISELKLGDTPLSEFEDVQYEIREGYSTDAPLTLYPSQVFEEQLSAKLTYPIDESGRAVDNATEGVPIVKITARDTKDISVDFVFPSGLVAFDKKTNRRLNMTVQIRIRERPLGGTTWTDITTLKVSRNEQRPLRATYKWTPAERGQYEVEITRMTIEHRTDDAIVDEVHWSALRSHRPEYILNFDTPVACAAMRIKATDQMQGTIQNFNALCQLLCKRWNGTTWAVAATSNPGDLYRHVLQGPANIYPKTDAELDLDDIQFFSEFCASKGLEYNRVHDFEGALWDAMRDVCGAGRAAPHDKGDKWGVIVDTPKTEVVAHITPRNSWDFKGTLVWPRLPDAFRISFLDETNGYQQAERIVPRPDFVGEPVVTEEIQLPGKTSPDEIWKEGRRRWYEKTLRPEIYSASQDMEFLQATRGDLVIISHFVLSGDMTAARVMSVDGQDIVLDADVTMMPAQTYAVRIRLSNGASLLRHCVTAPGVTNVLRVTGSLSAVEEGNLVQFGNSVEGPGIEAILTSKEPGRDYTAQLVAVPHAPTLEALVDADVPPAWDGRVGEILDPSLTAPAEPVIRQIESGTFINEEDAGLYSVVVRLKPGQGGVTPVQYALDHRVYGTSIWNTATVPVAEGAVKLGIGLYPMGEKLELRARAISYAGTSSTSTDIEVHTVGEADPASPEITVFTPTRLAEGYWQYYWEIETGSDVDSANGVEIRYKEGAFSDFEDLDPMHSGLLTITPWLIGLPATDGEWTFGIRSVTSDGNGPAYLVTVTVP